MGSRSDQTSQRSSRSGPSRSKLKNRRTKKKPRREGSDAEPEADEPADTEAPDEPADAEAADTDEPADTDETPLEIAVKKEWGDRGCGPSQAWPHTSSKAVGPSQPTVDVGARGRRKRRN